MNSSDWLVEVFVSANAKAKKCDFATGYPIGKNRIITAAHVLGCTSLQ